jgi:HEAT repeat protein
MFKNFLGKIIGSPDENAALKLLDQISFKGQWDNSAFATIEQLSKVVSSLMERSPHNADYLYLLGCCRYELGDKVNAITAFKRAVEFDPCHYQAQRMLSNPEQWSTLLRHPAWSKELTSVPQSILDRTNRGESFCIIRHKFEKIVSIFLQVDRDYFPPNISEGIGAGIEFVLSKTPYGSIVASYVVFYTHPDDPLVRELFLNLAAPSESVKDFSLYGGWLSREIASQNHIFLVPVEKNGSVIVNKLLRFDEDTNRNLSEIARSVESEITLMSNEAFKNAQNWHMANFDMKGLRLLSRGREAPKGVTQLSSATKSTNKPVEVSQLAQTLMNPEKAKADESTSQFPGITMVSIRFEETPTSKQRRLAAAQQLGEAGSSQAGEILARAYAEEKDDDVKREIAKSLEGLVNTYIEETTGKDAREVLTDSSWAREDLLRTSEVLFQKGIMSYFGKLGGERATTWLASRLDSTDISERIAALEALGEIGGTRAAALIVKFLGSSDRKEKQVAINALAKSGSEVGVGQLLEIFATEKDSKIRKAAIRAISSCKTKNSELAASIAALMVQSLSDSDLTVRDCALQWLKNTDGSLLKSIPELQITEARQKMIHLLEDQDINVRYHAIDALGEIGSADEISALETCAKTLKPGAVPRVKSAIKKIKQR